jgi:hypothetical protein
MGEEKDRARIGGRESVFFNGISYQFLQRDIISDMTYVSVSTEGS